MEAPDQRPRTKILMVKVLEVERQEKKMNKY